MISENYALVWDEGIIKKLVNDVHAVLCSVTKAIIETRECGPKHYWCDIKLTDDNNKKCLQYFN